MRRTQYNVSILFFLILMTTWKIRKNKRRRQQSSCVEGKQLGKKKIQNLWGIALIYKNDYKAAVIVNYLSASK
jgi:hypothetical protein